MQGKFWGLRGIVFHTGPGAIYYVPGREKHSESQCQFQGKPITLGEVLIIQPPFFCHMGSEPGSEENKTQSLTSPIEKRRAQKAQRVRMSSSFLDTSGGVRSSSSETFFCLLGSIELNCSQRSPSITFQGTEKREQKKKVRWLKQQLQAELFILQIP